MEIIDFDMLKDTIDQNWNSNVIITFHSMGDTDSVSSAFALRDYFENATIAMPDQITSNSRRILEKLDFKTSLITTKFDKDADMIILVDVNNFEDCSNFKLKLESFRGQILIIDHHTPNEIDMENVMVFNNESYNSTASIVYDLLKSLEFGFDKRVANLLATGILSDSAEFRNATPQTFVQIGELLEKAEIDYQSILLEMQHLADPETRQQFIKDLAGAKVTISGKLLMIYGPARIHANKIADDGIRVGSDVSIFYSTSKSEVSFSARLRPPLDKTYKINLGAIMKKLAPIIKGQGGGHPCAAGAYGPDASSAGKFLNAFINEINEHVHG